MWKYIRRYLPFAVLAGLFMIGEVLKSLGYSYNTTEQSQLDEAAAKLAGLKPNIRVLDYCRDTLRGIMRMGYMNGKWNVITMTLVPGSMGVRHFVPLCFVLSTIVLLLLTAFTRSMLFGGLLALEWGAYLLLDFFYSYTIAKEKGWRLLPVEPILYPAFHFAYGTGSLCGICALPRFIREERRKKREAGA